MRSEVQAGGHCSWLGRLVPAQQPAQLERVQESQGGRGRHRAEARAQGEERGPSLVWLTFSDAMRRINENLLEGSPLVLPPGRNTSRGDGGLHLLDLDQDGPAAAPRRLLLV